MLGRSEAKSGVLIYADLFAGCWGLSLGLRWAGFQRAAAIELSPDAAFSYYHNLVCREEVAPFKRSTFLDSQKLQVATGLIVGNIGKIAELTEFEAKHMAIASRVLGISMRCYRSLSRGGDTMRTIISEGEFDSLAAFEAHGGKMAADPEDEVGRLHFPQLETVIEGLEVEFYMPTP